MRVRIGLCVAGCYSVIEARMQAKLANSNRGRVMATYRTVDNVAGVSSVAFRMVGPI